MGVTKRKKRLIIILVVFFVLLTSSMLNKYYSRALRMSEGYTYGSIHMPPETFICLTEDERFRQHDQIFYKYDLYSKELSNIHQEILKEQKYLTSDYYVKRDEISPQKLKKMVQKRTKYLARKKDLFSHPAFCERKKYILFQLTKGDDAEFFHKYLIFGFFVLLTIEYLLTVTLKIDHDDSQVRKIVYYYAIATSTVIILFLSYWFYFIASHLG